MANQVGKKFAWVIKNFSSLHSEKCYSVPVLIGDNKWRLFAYPKGEKDGDYFSLYLDVVDPESLPSGWRKLVKFRLTILKQVSGEISGWREGHTWFDKVHPTWGFSSMILLTKLHDKNETFLANGELTIVAEVDVLDVIGLLDASEKSKESSRPLKKIKLNDDCAESNDSLKEASLVKQSIDVNGFHVLPSQVESVRSIFERHQDIAVNFRAKNQHVRTACMNVLLGLIKTLCQPLQELSNEDLVDTDIALTYLKDMSFKVDWLEKKLNQVKEKKEKEQFALAQLQETEENLLKLKQKFSELDALAEEHKAELLATRTLFSFDDVV